MTWEGGEGVAHAEGACWEAEEKFQESPGWNQLTRTKTVAPLVRL